MVELNPPLQYNEFTGSQVRKIPTTLLEWPQHINMGGSSLGRNASIYIAEQDHRHWSVFLSPEVNQEPQALARILRSLPKVHWSSGVILVI